MACMTLKFSSFSCTYAVSKYLIISPKVCKALEFSIILGELIDFNNSPTDSLSY